MNKRILRQGRHGFAALAVVIVFAFILTLMAFNVGEDTLLLQKSNFSDQLQKRANYAAYAAVQKCLAEMDKTTSYNSATKVYMTSFDPGTTITDIPLENDPDTIYTLRVANNSSGSLGNPFVHEDGTIVPSGLVYVKASARNRPSGNMKGRTYRAGVASLSFVGQVQWQHAMLATESVTLDNKSLVDSFRSSTGTGYPANKSSSATLGCNSIQKGIVLKRESSVQGRLRFGPKGDAATAIQEDPDVIVSGDRKAASSLFRIPRFKPPYNPTTATDVIALAPGETRTLVPGAYKSVTVPTGAKLVLQTRNYNDVSGTAATQYLINDNLVVSGGEVELQTLDAPVQTSRTELYIGESILVSSAGVINRWVDSTSRPSRLQCIFVGNGSPRSPQRLVVDGASKVWFLALGPGLDVTVDHSSEVFGGIRCFKALVDNTSAVHWDRAVTSDTRIRGQVAWTLKGLVQEGYDGDFELAFDPPGDSGGDGGGDGGGGDGAGDGAGDAGAGDAGAGDAGAGDAGAGDAGAGDAGAGDAGAGDAGAGDAGAGDAGAGDAGAGDAGGGDAGGGDAGGDGAGGDGGGGDGGGGDGGGGDGGGGE